MTLPKVDPNKFLRHLKNEYENGKTIQAIADDLGKSYHYVHHWLSYVGVTLRKRGGHTYGNRNPDYEDYTGPDRAEVGARMKVMYEQGSSRREVASKFNTSEQTARTMMKEAGTVFRDPGPVTRKARKVT